MQQYPLEALLHLREHRYNNAQKMKLAQREITKKSLQEFKDKEQEYNQFKEYKVQATNQIYNSIINQILSQDELNKVFAQVAQLDLKLQESLQIKDRAYEVYLKQKSKLEEYEQIEKQLNLAFCKLQKHKEKYIQMLKNTDEY